MALGHRLEAYHFVYIFTLMRLDVGDLGQLIHGNGKRRAMA